MKTIVDRKTWGREDIFKYFLNYENPFFTLTADIDVSGTYREAKDKEESFFLLSLHRLMKVMNSIKNFRYRIEGDNVVLYDKINTGPTIGRKDGTFAFSFLNYYEDYQKFRDEAKPKIEMLKNGSGLMTTADNERPDMAYFTAIPWLSFSEIIQPRRGGKGHGAPCIATGKLKKFTDKVLMPLSLTAHHSLLDGYHAGLFFNKAEEILR